VRHGTHVYNDQVRIPLAVRPPPGTDLPVALSPVGLLDVTATISAIATGQPMGRGRDLRNEDEISRVQIEFFGWRGSVAGDGPFAGLPARAVVEDRNKLIEIDGRRELYRLAGDPEEQFDRARADPDLVERMVPLLPPLERGVSKVERGEAMDRGTADALRALGYVE
jgi:arylsulfatase A-like enzyme